MWGSAVPCCRRSARTWRSCISTAALSRRPVWRCATRCAADLFRSKWWTVGWLVAVAAFLAHVGALSLRPLSTAQADLSGGFVLLAVLAERSFGFQLGRRQWLAIIIVAVSLALLGVTSKQSVTTA